MIRRLLAFPAALILLTSSAVQSAMEADPEEDSIIGPAVIYGEDNRIDVYQVGGLSGFRLRALAASTLGIFDAADVTVKDGRAHLSTIPYGKGMKLCRDEAFYEQETGPFCSGSLVGADLVMTAGHCVRSEGECREMKFVFDFAVREKGVLPASVPASSVYGCSKLVATVMEPNNGADWALVKIDRRVADRRPLPIRRAGRIRNGSKIFVIGHPSGLPTKIAGGASVRDNSPKHHFIANLDSYGGNSGSPVFNALTGRVEGILVRGEQDFEWRGSCQVSKRCKNGGCSGEEVTKAAEVASLIPGRAFASVEPRVNIPAVTAETSPSLGALIKGTLD